MNDMLTYRGTIYPWHCDHMGHMNNMWYIGKFDEATWNLLAELGITPAYLRESGCGMAALEQKTVFKRELLAGDVIEIRTMVVELGAKIIRFEHRMINRETGEECAACSLTGIHIDRTLRRSSPFPDVLRAKLDAFTALAEAA
jgi:acyl-CoA thioester hydrolase